MNSRYQSQSFSYRSSPVEPLCCLWYFLIWKVSPTEHRLVIFIDLQQENCMNWTEMNLRIFKKSEQDVRAKPLDFIKIWCSWQFLQRTNIEKLKNLSKIAISFESIWALYSYNNQKVLQYCALRSRKVVTQSIIIRLSWWFDTRRILDIKSRFLSQRKWNFSGQLIKHHLGIPLPSFRARCVICNVRTTCSCNFVEKKFKPRLPVL